MGRKTGDVELRDSQRGDLPAAGPFSVWAEGMVAALRGERDSFVPCGDCTACCTSSQFVHVGPGEIQTRARIHPELLFPAPGLPAGHGVLGYDEKGRCPLFDGRGCSIYDHRPRTCRVYDCRIFAATGLEFEEADRRLIADRARRWRFDVESSADRECRRAVRAAVRFLQRYRDTLPEDAAPRNTTQLAVLALEIHHLFLREQPAPGRFTGACSDPDPAEVLAEVTRIRG